MDTPIETNDINETTPTNEKLSPKGITAMQGESTIKDPTSIESDPSKETTKNNEKETTPPTNDSPPDGNLPSDPQFGIGERGIAKKIETGVEKPEVKIFYPTEDEEIHHRGGPEGGY